MPVRIALLASIVIGYAVISRFLLGDVALNAKGRVCGLRQWVHRQTGKVASRALLFSLGFIFIEEKGKRDVSLFRQVMGTRHKLLSPFFTMFRAAARKNNDRKSHRIH